jgi:glycosyltransferase involved in cell wall biosynthesis
VKLGHKVTVITGAPNYPEGVIYPGYKNKWYQREEMDGIEVVRVKTYMALNAGRVRRLIDFNSYALMAGIVALFRKRADIIVATSPQLFAGITACVLSFFHRRPWVFELRDMWPASVHAVGAVKPGRLIRFAEKIEMLLYISASRIVPVTNRFKEVLIERGVDGEKVDVVTNGVDLSAFTPAAEKDHSLVAEYGLADKFVVGYIGTHGMAQALHTVVRAAELLRNRDDIRFLFVGSGAERNNVESLARTLELDNVVMMPRQPKQMMPATWGLCDIALVPLKNEHEFTKVIPSKIFECMGMGLPMVVAVPPGEATGLVEHMGAGVAVPPEDPAAMAQAITELRKDRDRLASMAAASAASASQYDRRQLAAQMLQSLEKVVA